MTWLELHLYNTMILQHFVTSQLADSVVLLLLTKVNFFLHLLGEGWWSGCRIEVQAGSCMATAKGSLEIERDAR